MTDERVVRIGGSAIDPEELAWKDVWKAPVQVEAVKMNAPVTVETMEGTMEADAGSFLIRGVEGEVYPCDPGVFHQTYLSDESKVPKYRPEDLAAARQKFLDDTLEHIPKNTSSADARAGMRAFLDLLREEAEA